MKAVNFSNGEIELLLRSILISLIDTSEEIVSFISPLITGSVGHSQSSDNRNSGPVIQGRIFFRFFGATNRVPTSEGFRFVGI